VLCNPWCHQNTPHIIKLGASDNLPFDKIPNTGGDGLTSDWNSEICLKHVLGLFSGRKTFCRSVSSYLTW